MVLEYEAFSDESRHTASRFRAIAAVSLPAGVVTELGDELAEVLKGSSVTEFKWSAFQGGRDRHCAAKMVDFLIDRLLPAGARADILVWDTQDARHTVPGRDDRANFERMFFHLHRGLMERRELGARWHLRPDERQDVDWPTVKQCLASVGRWKKYFDDPLLGTSFSERFFDIQTLKEVHSHSTPLCQLADLLAGIGPYTRERAALVGHLLREAEGQGPIFPSDDVAPEPSNRDRDRVRVVKHLNDRCKRARLGLSLRTRGYLYTPDPTRPINFWHYVPQHDDDKAPTRDG